MKIFIYALVDPNTNRIRYIGKTNEDRKPKRLFEHCRPSSIKAHTHKNMWIKSLLKNNQKPILTVIDIADENTFAERERYWIKFYRQTEDLTNYTDGGEGCARISNRVISEEQKEKISQTLKTYFKEPKNRLTCKMAGEKLKWKSKKNSIKTSSIYQYVTFYQNKFFTSIKMPNKKTISFIANNEKHAAYIADIANLFFYGKECFLNFPERLSEYLTTNIKECLLSLIHVRTSKYKGVSLSSKEYNYWMARGANDKHLGTFKSEMEAALCVAQFYNVALESLIVKTRADIINNFNSPLYLMAGYSGVEPDFSAPSTAKNLEDSPG